MDLFEKEVEVEETRKKAKQMEKELMDSLRSQFVNLPYDVKEVEADYESYYNSSDRRIKVYYPILNTPEGFKKEEEKFYREYANCINHEYTLIDGEGRKIKILEHAIFTCNIYETKKAHMRLDFYVTRESIEYNISMFLKEYTLKRNFNYKQLLNEIIGKENSVRYKDCFKDCFTRKPYSQIEKEYQKFLKDLGIKYDPPTLKVMAKTVGETESKITESISVVISKEIDENYYHCIWLNNPKYSVRLDDVKYYKTTIKVKPYLNNTIKMEEREFCYAELENEEELRKGKTLDEIIELLESFQTE